MFAAAELSGEVWIPVTVVLLTALFGVLGWMLTKMVELAQSVAVVSVQVDGHDDDISQLRLAIAAR